MLDCRGRQTMFSWKQSLTFVPVLLIVLSTATLSNAVTEGRIDRIKNKVLDETQFSNPKSFDYNFEDDLRKPADTNDIYDELVPYLPTFVLHKNGKNVGRTSVPIITRKMPAWSTPPPKQKYVEPYKPPKNLDGFQTRPGLTGLTALADQTRFSQRFQQQQQQQRRIQTPLHTASVAPPRTLLLARSTTRKSTAVTTTVRTTTSRTPTLSRQQQQHQQRQLDVRPLPRPLSNVIRPTIGSRNYIANNNNNDNNNSHRQQQPRPLPKLIGYPQRLLSESRSSSDAAVIKSQPVERLNTGNGSNKSNTIFRSQSIQAHSAAKPLIIHTGNGPYTGPTFNCKVLTPKNDGRPSPKTDKTCNLAAPGISADGRCRCTFEVSGRDSSGCALGFLFTCLPK